MDPNEAYVAEIVAKREGKPKPRRKRSAVVPPECSNPGGATGAGWLPGQSGNPKGRPSLADEIMALLAETDERRGKRKVRCVAEALYSLAVDKGSTRAIELMMDRTDGKVAEEVAITVEHVTRTIDEYAHVALEAVTEAEAITKSAAGGA